MTTTIEAMNKAVKNAGGRMTEDEYLNAVQGIIEESGRTTSRDSLKVNAFNTARMDKAGVVRVTIGKQKQVWVRSEADHLLAGGTITSQPIVAAPTAPTQVTVQAPRAVTVPSSGAFHGIPRNDPSALPDRFRALIPEVKGFVESERGEMRLLAMRYRRSLGGDTTKAHVLSIGPKGCGKSMFAKDFFGNLNVPMLRINMSDGVTEENFIGTRTLRDGNVEWVHGLLVDAMENGYPLNAEEINGARENVLIALNMVMDTGMLTLGEDGGRVVRAAPGFMVIGTMNPPEDYAGVNDMNQATRDRFTFNLTFDYLPEDREVEVVMAQSGFRDEDTVRSLVRVANDLRRLKKDGQMETDTSTRTLVQVCDDLGDLSLTEALQYVMLGRYAADEVPAIEAVLRARLEDY